MCMCVWVCVGMRGYVVYKGSPGVSKNMRSRTRTFVCVRTRTRGWTDGCACVRMYVWLRTVSNVHVQVSRRCAKGSVVVGSPSSVVCMCACVD